MSDTPDATNILDALDKEGDAINEVYDYFNAKKSSYNTLIDGENLTKTETVYNTYSSRSMANYTVLIITVSINNYVRESCVLRRSILDNANYSTSLNYTTGGVGVELVIKKQSDTSFIMKYNSSTTATVTVWIDALALE